MDEATLISELRRAVGLFQAGDLAAAGAIAERLLRVAPQALPVLQLLGELAWRLGDNRQAEDYFARAVKAAPADAVARYRLGNLLLSRHALDAAEQQYREALRLQPEMWQARVNLGLLHRSQGDFRQARDQFEAASQQQPGNVAVTCYYLDLLLSLGELSTIDALANTVQQLVDRCIGDERQQDFHALMYLAPLLRISDADQDALAAKIDRQLSGRPALARQAGPHQERIRVGYVSPDFGDHPVGHVLQGVFAQHDHGHFEIHAYALGLRDRESDRPYRDSIEHNSDQFTDLAAYTPQQAAQQIAADGIDVLVNLSGYMSPPALEIFAWRPAPVQVYWLGHGGVTGLSFIDYVIADAIVLPPGDDRRYRETIWRMPAQYHCADTPHIADQRQQRAAHGLDEQAFVFCAFNNPNKIDSRVFDAWMEILRGVPGSQLWLSNPGGCAELRDNLRREAKRRGIDGGRLVFAGHVADKSLHLARHRLADLFIDTFTYNASTTAIDALWSGLPVLTCAGSSFYSRICASHVTHAGLGDMVCSSPQEFTQRAVRLAAHPEELAALRERLAGDRTRLPLFDSRRFTADLESAFTAMLQASRLPAR